jgi:hypothetical protein
MYPARAAAGEAFPRTEKSEKKNGNVFSSATVAAVEIESLVGVCPI